MMVRSVKKFERLGHVDMVIKFTMEKCIEDILLENFIVILYCDGEENVNGLYLRDGVEGLIVVNVLLLLKPCTRRCVL